MFHSVFTVFYHVFTVFYCVSPCFLSVFTAFYRVLPCFHRVSPCFTVFHHVFSVFSPCLTVFHHVFTMFSQCFHCVLPCSGPLWAAWPSLPLWRTSAACGPARSSVRGWHLHTERSEVNVRVWGQAVALGRGGVCVNDTRPAASGRQRVFDSCGDDVTLCLCLRIKTHWSVSDVWCLALPFALTCTASARTHTHTHTHRERETDRHTHTHTHTQRDRHTHTHTHADAAKTRQQLNCTK